MANIVLRLSGGATNTTPAYSIGGDMSTEVDGIVTSAVLNNLFDNVTKAENFAGHTDYRCIYVHNDTATSGALFGAGEIYIGNTPLASIELGIGDKGVAAEAVVNEQTAPTGITFYSTDSSNTVAFNVTLEPGEWIPVWVKRVSNNITGTGSVTDTITLVVKGVE